MSQSHADLKRRVAETDTTFALNDELWVGRCLAALLQRLLAERNRRWREGLVDRERAL